MSSTSAAGTGQTTRQAAPTAQAGSALGVDISAPAVERARELARAEGLGNVTFEHVNAQVHRFPHERFDLAISRSGKMFFDDARARTCPQRLRAEPRPLAWRRRDPAFGQPPVGQQPPPATLAA
ncbi:MAG TPA: class I SAM-dependent methyltransferase [Streptosporangiaceae bacterium]|nr:class I SAM-dependent methyltransferase [Streptosporangiaceae bacterium]